MAVNGMGKDLYQSYIWQRVNIQHIQILKTVNSRDPNNPIEKWGTELNREFSIEET